MTSATVRTLPDLAVGYWAHNRHKVYKVSGVALSGIAEGVELASMTVLGDVAFYSEQPACRLVLARHIRSAAEDFFYWEVPVVGNLTLGLRMPMAYYGAIGPLPSGAGAHLPRHTLRPLTGENGFLADTMVYGNLVPRFDYLGSALPSKQLGHVANPKLPGICRSCNRPMASQII